MRGTPAVVGRAGRAPYLGDCRADKGTRTRADGAGFAADGVVRVDPRRRREQREEGGEVGRGRRGERG